MQIGNNNWDLETYKKKNFYAEPWTDRELESGNDSCQGHVANHIFSQAKKEDMLLSSPWTLHSVRILKSQSHALH